MDKQPFIDFSFIKAHADFDKVLTHYSLSPIRAGLAQLTLRCPFHDDTKPSLKITASKKGFHCFGCGAKGNVLDFVSRMEETDLRTAAETLATICGIELAAARAPQSPQERPQRAKQPPTRIASSPAKKPRPEAPAQPSEPVRTVNPVLRFELKLDPAHPYLEERGLTKETIEHFGLGLSSGKGIHAGRIAIPIHNERGELVAYAGRWPGEHGWPAGEERYKLPAGFLKSQVLYNLHRVAGQEHLVLVEGYFAVFRLCQAGIAAVALMGNSISPEQVALLTDAGVERVTVLLDGDAPGRAAAVTVVATLAPLFFVHEAVLPENTQPDDLDLEELTELVLGR